MIALVFFVVTLVYLGSVGYLAYHWWKIEVPESQGPIKSGMLVSVIVVVRNEEANIIALLQDLAGQSFLHSEFEVLVINDHSEDETCRKVLGVAPDLPYKLRLLHLGPFTGKKAGLELGVREAAGSVILVTDGDCRLPVGWLRGMTEMFSKTNAVFVAGPVTFSKEETLFEKLQTIEFASLVGAGAAMIRAGKEGMCNAANMAFSKHAFEKVQALRKDIHIPSGDDGFLLQSLGRQYPGQVFFLKDKKAVVQTRGQQSWSDFYQQRKRWAGKWRLHKEPAILLTAGAVFFLQLSWLLGAVLMLYHYPLFYFFAGVLLKFGAEFLFLRAVLRCFGKRILLFPFLLLQLLYPFYVLFFGLAVNFGNFTWKGRTYNYSKL